MRLARTFASGLLVATCLTPFGPIPIAGGAGPEPTWTERFGDRLDSIATEGGRLVVAGVREPPGPWDPGLVVRTYRPSGAAVWTRRWNPRHGSVTQAHVALGSDGHVVVAGRLACDLGAECLVWYVRVYSRDGDLLWTRAPGLHGQTGAGEASGVVVTDDGIVVSGHCCGWGSTDGWVRAYDLEGNLRWTRDLVIAGSRRLDDAAMGIAADEDGDLFVVGWVARGPEDLTGPADRDIVIQRLDPSGAVRWTRVLPDRRPEDVDTATSVAIRGDRLAVSGIRAGVDYAGVRWVGGLSTDGHLDWTDRWGRWRGYGTPPTVEVLATGGVVVSSSSRDPSKPGIAAAVRGYSTGGRLRWVVSLAGEEPYAFATQVAVDGPSAIFVTGLVTESRRDDTGIGLLWRLDA